MSGGGGERTLGADGVPVAEPRRMTVPTAPRPVRVTLLRPNVLVLPKSLTVYGPTPPLGLAYIAGALREAGHAVDVIDSAGEGIDTVTDVTTPAGTLHRIGLTTDDVLDRIDPRTELIGITHMFVHEWPIVRDLAEAAKQRFPDAVVALGGENATAFWPWILEQTDAVDVCVLGEGEATTIALADRIAAGRGVDGLPGTAVRSPNGPAVSTGLAPRLRSADLHPRPAWDLFPLERYWSYGDLAGIDLGRSMPMLATRGCPYSCSFCSSPQMWTTRYVVRDPDDVALEVAEYVERYGVSNIYFADLTAVTKRSWTLDFCDALDEHAPGITWQLPVGTRSEVLDGEVLQRLWDTGCRTVVYAPEAGGERMLRRYDKRVDLDHLLTSLRAASSIGLVTRVNIIIGHPDERWADVWQSLRFLVRAARSGADDAAVMMFGPYPGSADFEALVRQGSLVIDDAFYYVALSWASSAHSSYNPTMSARALRVAQLVLLATFYLSTLVLRPRGILRLVRAQCTGEERTALDALIRSKRHGSLPKRRRDAATTAVRAAASPRTMTPFRRGDDVPALGTAVGGDR